MSLGSPFKRAFLESTVNKIAILLMKRRHPFNVKALKIAILLMQKAGNRHSFNGLPTNSNRIITVTNRRRGTLNATPACFFSCQAKKSYKSNYKSGEKP